MWLNCIQCFYVFHIFPWQMYISNYTSLVVIEAIKMCHVVSIFLSLAVTVTVILCHTCISCHDMLLCFSLFNVISWVSRLVPLPRVCLPAVLCVHLVWQSRRVTVQFLCVYLVWHRRRLIVYLQFCVVYTGYDNAHPGHRHGAAWRDHGELQRETKRRLRLPQQGAYRHGTVNML